MGGKTWAPHPAHMDLQGEHGRVMETFGVQMGVMYIFGGLQGRVG